jgi:hypothetical protein
LRESLLRHQRGTDADGADGGEVEQPSRFFAAEYSGTMPPPPRLPTLVLLGIALGSAERDFVDAYGLTAHRATFDDLGLTTSDLVHLDGADVVSLKARMKKYEAARFDRAIADAQRLSPPDSAAAAVFAPPPREATSSGRILSEAAGASRADEATRLKAYLLLGRNGTGLPYDKTVVPSSPSDGPVTVSLALNLYHMYGLDMRRATVSIHLWLRMSWVDPRLSWEPSDWGGVQSLTFIASPASIEESQIWTPEVELYQAERSTYAMAQKEVIVFANGTTFWSRPGEVPSLCELDGLHDFPFDRVMCKLRFGGWSLPGSLQNVTADPVKPLDDKLTHKATYQEYRVVGGSVTRGVDTFGCCPDPMGWPYVEFAFTLGRAEKQYNIKIIMLNIVLTYLSFGVFLIDPKTGERLQFSTTVLLTIVAADSLVTGVVPICNPLLWIEWFFLVCWAFCILSILGNMITHWLYWKASDRDALPRQRPTRSRIPDPGSQIHAPPAARSGSHPRPPRLAPWVPPCPTPDPPASLAWRRRRLLRSTPLARRGWRSRRTRSPSAASASGARSIRKRTRPQCGGVTRAARPCRRCSTRARGRARHPRRRSHARPRVLSCSRRPPVPPEARARGGSSNGAGPRTRSARKCCDATTPTRSWSPTRTSTTTTTTTITLITPSDGRSIDKARTLALAPRRPTRLCRLSPR